MTFLFGASIGPFTTRLMQWIYEEGYCDEATRDKDWLDYANLLYSGAEPIEEYDRLKRVIGDFCAVKTKAELLEAACERMLLIAPVATPDDVLHSAQFAARDYIDEVADDVLSADGRSRAPGPWVRSSRRRRRSASGGRRGSASTPPRCSAAPRGAPATLPGAGGATRRPPLDGVKVLDLTWAMAGPATTRVMADFGADVIRVETSHHLDVARTIGPFVNDVPGNDSVGPAVQHDDRQAQHQPRPAPAAGPRGARRPRALVRRRHRVVLAARPGRRSTSSTSGSPACARA